MISDICIFIIYDIRYLYIYHTCYQIYVYIKGTKIKIYVQTGSHFPPREQKLAQPHQCLLWFYILATHKAKMLIYYKSTYDIALTSSPSSIISISKKSPYWLLWVFPDVHHLAGSYRLRSVISADLSTSSRTVTHEFSAEHWL